MGYSFPSAGLDMVLFFEYGTECDTSGISAINMG